MTGTIVVTHLELWVHVGVPDEERATPQRLLLSLELDLNVSRAAATDDIASTIDYDRLTRRVRSYVKEGSWRLIEKLGSDIGQLILREYQPERVRIELQKFILKDCGPVCFRLALP